MSKSSSVTLRKSLTMVTPALLTRMSRGFDHGLARVCVGDVDFDDGGLDAELGKFRCSTFGFVGLATGDRDIGARLRKPARHAEADAAVATRDECDLAFEIEE